MVNDVIHSIEAEICKRQNRSDSISCPAFFPVVQALVNPNKEPHRSSHSKSHSKQKKSTGGSSPRSTFSDLSVDDSFSFTGKSMQYSVKMEPITSMSPKSEPSVLSPKSPSYSLNSQGRVYFIIVDEWLVTYSQIGVGSFYRLIVLSIFIISIQHSNQWKLHSSTVCLLRVFVKWVHLAIIQNENWLNVQNGIFVIPFFNMVCHWI